MKEKIHIYAKKSFSNLNKSTELAHLGKQDPSRKYNKSFVYSSTIDAEATAQSNPFFIELS